VTIITQKNWKRVYKEEGAIGHLVLSRNNLELVNLNLDAGGIVAEHTLPFPAIFYIIKGEGTFILDGESFKVSKDSTITVGPDILRGWANDSSNTLEVLVIKQQPSDDE